MIDEYMFSLGASVINHCVRTGYNTARQYRFKFYANEYHFLRY
jgi:hypothetical protein